MICDKCNKVYKDIFNSILTMDYEQGGESIWLSETETIKLLLDIKKEHIDVVFSFNPFDGTLTVVTLNNYAWCCTEYERFSNIPYTGFYISEKHKSTNIIPRGLRITHQALWNPKLLDNWIREKTKAETFKDKLLTRDINSVVKKYGNVL